MGTKHPDQIGASHWRGKAETVLDMFRFHWDVQSICRHCSLRMQVDLRIVAVYAGRDYSLWNKHPPCRRLHCPGRVDFEFKAPGMTRHRPLAAPDREPLHVMGHVERAFEEEKQRLAREAQARRIVLGEGSAGPG